MLLFLLLLAFGPQGMPLDDRGEILIRIEPGLNVLLDGEPVGITSARENGLLIQQVRPGMHKLKFEGPGVSLETPVEVIAGQRTPVTISSLTLRAAARKRKSDVEVRVDTDSVDCSAAVGEWRQPMVEPPSLLFEDVAIGKQRVSVTCDGRTLNLNVDIAAGRKVVIGANFRTKSIKVVEDKTRIKELVVRSSRDSLMDAPISANAKRALMAAIPANVTVLDFYVRGDRKFVVRLESTRSGDISTVTSRLLRSGEVISAQSQLIEELDNPPRARTDVIILFGNRGMVAN
ncbi:MAG: hypothetical protein ACTHQM_01465 [Thermoanaerobaculia bacterium]